MSKIIGGYFCEKLQHWVKVIKPTKDNYRPSIHSKKGHRMKGSERKAEYEPQTIEASLYQQAAEFLRRKEMKIEKAKERS